MCRMISVILMWFQKNVRRPKQQKSKKRGHNKLNVRLAPYHISDGDEIGVKASVKPGTKSMSFT